MTTESSETDMAKDLRQIKHDVRVQGNMMKLMLFSQATVFAESVVTQLESDEVLFELFISVDGATSKDELTKKVIALGLKNGGRSSVYSKFAHLEDLALIEPVAGGLRGAVYAKTAISESLRIEMNPAIQRLIKLRKAANR